jgi:hypothetical protein
MLGRVIASRRLQALLVAAILILAAWQIFLSGTRFDRAGWLAADPAARTRADMAGDLVARYRLEGRTYIQVVNLLGPPTPTTQWQDRELAYVLGPRRPWRGAGREWLLLDVDRAERVVHSELTHD